VPANKLVVKAMWFSYTNKYQKIPYSTSILSIPGSIESCFDSSIIIGRFPNLTAHYASLNWFY
jgi:hypothetical protein